MYQLIWSPELKLRLAEQSPPILLDVRQIEEYQVFHLPDAVLIPLNELAERFDELANYQQQEIVVYCKAGIRSAVACEFLVEHGFTKLTNLADGVLGWSQLSD